MLAFIGRRLGNWFNRVEQRRSNDSRASSPNPAELERRGLSFETNGYLAWCARRAAANASPYDLEHNIRESVGRHSST
jgi:hypothetical protein